ncbi:conserved protein of unknown function [Ectopseudomonas oleovorans]|uniref:Uncharacterized protein n=1 Tax=Ectopseudomonas oleovorans TaxID=301 RepID=A0A653B3M9_ECTOL|nr:conserved protein of unknown function [Pseudomonas oleovorans]
MALRGVDLQVADVLLRRRQGVDDFPRAGGGEAPVGGEGHQAEIRLGHGQGLRQVAILCGGRVEVVQRLGHQQVGVGVEAAGELLALVAQVALDLELDAVEVVVELLALQATAEFLAHGVIGQVGDVADHARQHQAALGNHALLLEMAAMELRVGEDGLARHFVEGDVLRRQLGCRGDGQAVTHALRVADGPLHGLHATEAATDHGGPALDAELVGQTCLAVHPVFHGHHREVGAVGLAGGRVGAAGAGGTVAAAEVVEADDEELAGVDGLAGADAAVPPAGFAVVRAVVAGGVVVTGQGMADQHGIAACGVEFAIGFDDQFVLGQAAAAGQGQWFAELEHLGTDQADGIFGKGSGHGVAAKESEEGASLKSEAGSGKRAGAPSARHAAPQVRGVG